MFVFLEKYTFSNVYAVIFTLFLPPPIREGNSHVTLTKESLGTLL